MQPYIAGVVMLACIEHHLFVFVPFWAPLIWVSFCRSPVRTD